MDWYCVCVFGSDTPGVVKSRISSILLLRRLTIDMKEYAFRFMSSLAMKVINWIPVEGEDDDHDQLHPIGSKR